MLPILEIIRLEHSLKCGTFGVMRINKNVFCYTLERPDILNETSVSSIPTGQYMVKRKQSHNFGNTFEIMFVPGRTNILFHWGNLKKDTMGCILLGESVGKVYGKNGILKSKKTFNKFIKYLKGYNTLSLTIKEFY